MDRHDFADFLRAPHVVYEGDPNWVPPLTLERRLHFSHRNPFFAHAQAQYFTAYRNGEPAGRISAQIDDLAQPEAGPRTGHFGCLEAVDTAALTALTATAEDWLRERDCTVVQGPYSLSINDEVGLLIKGSDQPPRLLMNYAPPWYATALETAGYTKAQDLIAYNFNAATPRPAGADRLAAHVAHMPGLTERPMNPRHFRRELQTVVDVFNDAWAENWGFVPMTDAEAKNMADSMKPLIRPELVRFVEREGYAVGIIVALPDLNEAIADMKGRLLPFNWARLIWRLKKIGLKGARVLLMGVRREYRVGFQASAIAGLLVSRLYEAARREGYENVELSWVLENNRPTRKLIETIGGTPYKRYRIYGKPL